MDNIMSKLRSLDAYPKINEDFYSRTLSGGVITLVSSVVMFLLFFSELRKFPFFLFSAQLFGSDFFIYLSLCVGIELFEFCFLILKNKRGVPIWCTNSKLGIKSTSPDL